MKLRKMLGDWRQPELQAIMRQIETQSKITIVRWCVDYATHNFLPLCKDVRAKAALHAATSWLEGKMKLPEAKKIILDCHALARELENDPARQAAARAVGQAASTVHVATHALGLAFYGGAAIAYTIAGLSADAKVYNQIATAEFQKQFLSLKAASIENEANPVKVNWNC